MALPAIRSSKIDKNARNSILLYGGANQKLTTEHIDEVLSHFGANDILLLQNEVNLLSYIVDKAYEKGMQIALNPSPFNEKLDAVDMKKISIFLLNEVEGFLYCRYPFPTFPIVRRLWKLCVDNYTTFFCE